MLNFTNYTSEYESMSNLIFLIFNMPSNTFFMITVLEKKLNFQALLNNEQSFNDKLTLLTYMKNITIATLENPNIKAVLGDKNQKFDLVLAEWMFSETYSG